MSHFQVERCIGRGGFGKVNCVAKLSAPNKDTLYAMKALEKTQIIATNMFSEVFRELMFLKTLHSQHICNGHFAFQDNAHLYLVMDLSLGGDMRVTIQAMAKKNQHFTIEQIKFMFGSLILALDFCHDKLILHRDIKPDNVLVGADGTLRLTDFGISAKIKDKKTPCHASSGTLEYMAPEIKRKNHMHLVPSEVYSAGVYLHEIVFLKLPGLTGSPEMFEKLTRKEDYCSPELKDMALRCLERDEEKRLGNTQEILKEFKAEPFYKGFDWESLDNGSMKPPYVPDTSSVNVSGGAKMEDMMDQLGGDLEEDMVKIEQKYQDKFTDYGWNNELKMERSIRSSRSLFKKVERTVKEPKVGAMKFEDPKTPEALKKKLSRGGERSILRDANRGTSSGSEEDDEENDEHKKYEEHTDDGCVNKKPRGMRDSRRPSKCTLTPEMVAALSKPDLDKTGGRDHVEGGGIALETPGSRAPRKTMNALVEAAGTGVPEDRSVRIVDVQ